VRIVVRPPAALTSSIARQRSQIKGLVVQASTIPPRNTKIGPTFPEDLSRSTRCQPAVTVQVGPGPWYPPDRRERFHRQPPAGERARGHAVVAAVRDPAELRRRFPDIRAIACDFNRDTRPRTGCA
jgi:hypothetical protein